MQHFLNNFQYTAQSLIPLCSSIQCVPGTVRTSGGIYFFLLSEPRNLAIRWSQLLFFTVFHESYTELPANTSTKSHLNYYREVGIPKSNRTTVD